MFNFIKRISRNYFLSVMEKEIKSFVISLQGMDAEEIGMLLTFATHIRNNFFYKTGLDLNNPFFVVTKDPWCAMTVNKFIQLHQKEHHLANAAGGMIWLHTLRAASEPELRTYGRKMWKELTRGFPYVEEAKKNISLLSSTKSEINIEGFNIIPSGLEPID